MFPTSSKKDMEVIQHIIGEEDYPFITYEPLAEESIIVRVKGSYARYLNGDIVEDGDTVELHGYDIELVS